MVSLKKCSVKNCSNINPQGVSNFYPDRRNSDGLQPCCKECSRARTLQWRDKNRPYLAEYNKKPEVRLSRRNGHLKRTYGIGLDEYRDMFIKQKGLCAICKTVGTVTDHKSKKIRGLATDHNHITGAVRGLLCGSCNSAIGLLKADHGPRLLIEATKYLSKTN